MSEPVAVLEHRIKRLRVAVRQAVVAGDRERACALRGAEDAEDAAEADAAIDERGESILWEQLRGELGL